METIRKMKLNNYSNEEIMKKLKVSLKDIRNFEATIKPNLLADETLGGQRFINLKN